MLYGGIPYSVSAKSKRFDWSYKRVDHGMSSPKYKILLAEDNPNDLLFIKRAIDRGGLPFILYHVVNGEEAVRYLQGEGQYGDRERYPIPSLGSYSK